VQSVTDSNNKNVYKRFMTVFLSNEDRIRVLLYIRNGKQITTKQQVSQQ
jgi:hypothetical protein